MIAEAGSLISEAVRLEQAECGSRGGVCNNRDNVCDYRRKEMCMITETRSDHRGVVCEKETGSVITPTGGRVIADRNFV